MGFIFALADAAADSGVSCRTIIYALAAAVAGMAGFIVKQFLDRISDLKETNALASTLEEVVQKERGRDRG